MPRLHGDADSVCDATDGVTWPRPPSADRSQLSRRRTISRQTVRLPVVPDDRLPVRSEPEVAAAMVGPGVYASGRNISRLRFG